MSIMKLIVVYIIMAVIFILMQFLWLDALAKGFYQEELAIFMVKKNNWFAGTARYLVYTTGILVFAVLPALTMNSLTRALSFGAFLGLFAYGTYNLGNLMILKGWPVSILTVDLVWGTLLTCITSAVGFIVALKLL